jgi:hypothetical protein
MRVIAAAVSVFALMLGLAGLASYLNLFAYPRATGIGIGVLTLIASFAALALFNKRQNLVGHVSPDQHLRELESQGLLVSEEYVATRAFEVEEFEDEGMHFFVELKDGRVLFLSGQYLYDYEPIEDRKAARPRRFPCSEFTIRRHRNEKYVADLVCKGPAIEPEVVAPPFAQKDWRAEKVPSDGEIISDTPYEELKRQRLAAAG